MLDRVAVSHEGPSDMTTAVDGGTELATDGMIEFFRGWGLWWIFNVGT
jgi:hypothetical protein